MPASGRIRNHPERQEAGSKYIALSWPVSHPKPERTAAQGHMAPLDTGPSELLSPTDGRDGRKDRIVIFTDLVNCPGGGRLAP